MYPLCKNQFLVYLPTALNVPIKCVNGTKTENHLGSGSQTFTLSSGCEAQFLEHLVLSDLNIKMPADVLHFTWNWTPADLFEQTEQVAPQIRRLETLGMSRPKLKDLKKSYLCRIWIDWMEPNNFIRHGRNFIISFTLLRTLHGMQLQKAETKSKPIFWIRSIY